MNNFNTHRRWYKNTLNKKISAPKVHEVGSYKSIYAGAGQKAEQLSIEFKAVVYRHTCVFLDCYPLIQSCNKEGIHLPVSEHRELANRLPDGERPRISTHLCHHRFWAS